MCLQVAQLIRQSLAADREREERQRALQRDYDQQKRMLEQLQAGGGAQVPPGRAPPSYQEATAREPAAGHGEGVSQPPPPAPPAPAPAPPPPAAPEQPELESRLKEVRFCGPAVLWWCGVWALQGCCAGPSQTEALHQGFVVNVLVFLCFGMMALCS